MSTPPLDGDSQRLAIKCGGAFSARTLQRGNGEPPLLLPRRSVRARSAFLNGSDAEPGNEK